MDVLNQCPTYSAIHPFFLSLLSECSQTLFLNLTPQNPSLALSQAATTPLRINQAGPNITMPTTGPSLQILNLIQH